MGEEDLVIKPATEAAEMRARNYRLGLKAWEASRYVSSPEDTAVKTREYSGGTVGTEHIYDYPKVDLLCVITEQGFQHPYTYDRS